MQDNSENKVVIILKFIEFTSTWENCDTSKLDEISPSWFRRRDELEKTSSEYADFMERLKRQHAIETGVIERMYDISKGVTETLIESIPTSKCVFFKGWRFSTFVQVANGVVVAL